MSDVSVDLSPVFRALEVVNRNIGAVAENVHDVGTRVDDVAQEQAGTRRRLEELYAEFKDYVDKDVWSTEVSAARESLQIVMQKLEKQFGHYDEVRRLAPGILQAVDAGVVHEDSIRRVVEEKFLTATGYWLTPSLVALAAWIADNKALADHAVHEGIKRDDSKTSLFFALVCRRARRTEACALWLGRYFQCQSPQAMDGEVLIMLDALANGVFGGTALWTCSKVIDQWLVELEHEAGFQDEQRKRWAKALDAMTPTVGESEYPTLRSYSPTWPRLEASLASARRNEIVRSFFETLFTGETVVAPGLEVAVDKVLTGLVTDFDDEELPLRREAKSHEIIIDVDKQPGSPAAKRTKAQRIYQEAEEALKAQTSFAAHLTNAAMSNDRFDASLATRRYAVSRSRMWIIAGVNDLTARDRAAVPTDVELKCGSWKGTSRDGSNQQSLEADLSSHYAARIEAAVAAVKITAQTWVVVGLGLLFALLMAGNGSMLLGLLIMVAAGAYFYFQHQALEKRRQDARAELEKERDDAARILKAAMAELTDLRREIAKEDAKSEQVLTLLAALSSPQFVLNRPGQGRSISA